MSQSFGDDFENPYAAEAQSGQRQHHEIELPDHQHRGKINQVTPLGILMAVNGTLVLLAGIALIVFAFVMPEMIRNNPAFQNNPGISAEPQHAAAERSSAADGAGIRR